MADGAIPLHGGYVFGHNGVGSFDFSTFSRDLLPGADFECSTIRAMITENSTKKTQAKAFSYFAFAGNMGIFAGPLIGMFYT